MSHTNQVINQDKAWDQPSPHPDRHNSDSMWKSSMNTTGTEIWENSVRHKNNSHNKQPDAVTASAANPAAAPAGAVSSGPTSHSNSQSWNHTPATHIGGTWGEEEDSSSMWSGVPHTNGSSNHSHSSTSNNSNGSWGGNRPADTAITSDPLSSGWKGSDRRSDVPDMAVRSNHLPNHNNHIQQQQPVLHPSSSWNGTSSSSNHHHHNNNHTGSSMNWDEPHQHQHQPSERLGTSGWSADPPPVPKPTLLLRSESQPVQSGWKKESGSGWDVPDTRTLLANGGVDRRPDQGPGAEDRSGGVDDGTAAWGNPVRQQAAKIHRWKNEEDDQQQQQPDTSHPLSNHSNAKMPAAAISANGIGAPSLSPNGIPVLSSPGMIRLPPSSTKEAAAWVKSQPPGAWPDQWNEEKGQQQQRGWGDTSLWNQRKANWSDGQVDTSSWNGPKHKPLTKEMICASKQFRLLCEMGFRKDDVESCLRSANMNEHEALSELRAWSADERRKSSPGNTPTTTSLLLTSAGPNTSLSGSGITGRTMPQAFPSVSITYCSWASHSPLSRHSFNQVNEVTSALRSQSASRGISGQANVPSEKQLLHLVQQIQLAVQSGHLNAQV
jgi:trinucleotide repeat-containing gene 6 protein